MVDLVARVQLAPSKSEARRLVQSGGVYVNNRRVADPQARLTRDQAIGGRLFVLRKGQKQKHLVRSDLTRGRRSADVDVTARRYAILCRTFGPPEILPGSSAQQFLARASPPSSAAASAFSASRNLVVDRVGWRLVTLEGSPKRAAADRRRGLPGKTWAVGAERDVGQGATGAPTVGSLKTR